jgi:hypothetical protein
MDEPAGQEKSGSAERRRLTIPRWVLRAWLWISLPVGLTGYYGIPGLIVHGLWLEIGNTISIPFSLVPVTLALFFPEGTPAILSIILFGVMTALMDRVIVKRVPGAMPLVAFAGAMVAWLILSAMPFLVWIGLAML